MTQAKLYTGDALTVLRSLPDGVARCCVTSPPYWGLRDYGVLGQIGLEPTPEEYVSRMVEVFREVRRVLADDGTLWLNLGDSYASAGERSTGRNDTDRDTPGGRGGSFRGGERRITGQRDGLKPKDLVGIPWRVALALQSDGWYLRSDIIWAKPNPMPESVTDRPTKAHEYVFLLSKSERYYYDAAAIAEPVVYGDHPRNGVPGPDIQAPGQAKQSGITKRRRSGNKERVYGKGRARPGSHLGASIPWEDLTGTRNARSVWEIATTPYPGAHFATFPPELARRCIVAGTSQRGGCPECGKPWERQVERTPMVIARSERTHEKGRTRSSGTMLSPPIAETVGWAPTCDHGHEPVPDTVLDPFSGSGTTVAAATGHGRTAIGIELNPKYQELARHRIGPMLCELVT